LPGIGLNPIRHIAHRGVHNHKPGNYVPYVSNVVQFNDELVLFNRSKKKWIVFRNADPYLDRY
jgi:hypothetical protein